MQVLKLFFTLHRDLYIGQMWERVLFVVYDKSIFLQWCEKNEYLVCVAGLFSHFDSPLLHCHLSYLWIISSMNEKESGL